MRSATASTALRARRSEAGDAIVLMYLCRRVAAVVPVVFIVAVLVFLMLRLTPGDPAAVIAGNSAWIGRSPRSSSFGRAR
jgi:succinate dehydrogenase hydrophobic anchor subunit